MKVKILINMLKLNGWVQVRMRGSHRQYQHPKKKGTVTVSGKLSAEIPVGTQNSILRQAGLK